MQVAAVITIDPPSESLASQAAALSQSLGLPVVDLANAPVHELVLAVTASRLELRWADPAEQEVAQARRKSNRPGQAFTGGPIFADWSSLKLGSGPGWSLNQPIAKAVGLKSHHPPGPRVIDATAGWGEDAWLMASLGCSVVMVERCPLIATMLRDALVREARRSPQTVARMSVVQADALTYLREHGREAEVIHLDPMFPGEKSAAEKKPMRLLRRLVGDDGDAGQLLEAALATGVDRVLVKRPPHAPPLGGQPDVVYRSKASRYDVYLGK